MLIINRNDAKNLLGLATAYDTLAGESGVAVTEEMKNWNSEQIIVKRSQLSINLLAEAPVLQGWAATNEWLDKQYVVL